MDLPVVIISIIISYTCEEIKDIENYKNLSSNWDKAFLLKNSFEHIIFNIEMNDAYNFLDKNIVDLSKNYPLLNNFNFSYAFQLNDVSIKLLTSSYPNMTSCELHSCNKITVDGFKYLCMCTKLKNLSPCGVISDQGLIALKSCESLRFLDLAWCFKLTNVGFLELNPHLTELDLTWCNISCVGLQVFKNNNNLEKLNLTGCRKIVDNDLIILTTMKKLTKLILGFCDKITIAGVDKMKINMNPKIRIIFG